MKLARPLYRPSGERQMTSPALEIVNCQLSSSDEKLEGAWINPPVIRYEDTLYFVKLRSSSRITRNGRTRGSHICVGI